MPVIELITKIAAPIEVCFDLSRDIDAHQSSMKHSREKAVAGVTTGLIAKGQSVTWQAKHFGLKMHMTVEIVEMSKPHFFVDVMTKGPFKKLYHKHSFEEQLGYTIMKDVFEFKAPLGLLGRVVEVLFLKKYMYKLLIKRNEELKKLAEKK